MGRREWNQGLTLSPRYGNVLYVADGNYSEPFRRSCFCKQDAVYVFCIAKGFFSFFKIVLLSVAVALALSI